MRGAASPVFSARVTDVDFDKKRPCCRRLQSWLELSLFFPDEPSSHEQPLPLEYVLRGTTARSYVHFLISGIATDTGPEELHRLCLLLLMVRDTFYDGLEVFASQENR